MFLGLRTVTDTAGQLSASPQGLMPALPPGCRPQWKRASLLPPRPGFCSQPRALIFLSPAGIFLLSLCLLLPAQALLGGPLGQPTWPLLASTCLHGFAPHSSFERPSSLPPAVTFSQWLAVLFQEFGGRSKGGVRFVGHRSFLLLL